MSYRMIVQLGDRSHRIPLKPGEYLVGSSPDCTIKIGHPTVSRNHADLVVDDEGVALADRRSSNGTRVDGSKI